MMNLTEEWKSLWPISSVHSLSLLLSPFTITIASDATRQIGTLIFNPSPKPQSHHHLFTSSSVSPHFPPPFPNLSLSIFLTSLLLSTITSIASQIFFASSNPNPLLPHNSLQLLTCHATNSILEFFSSGPNSDQLGFVVLSVEDSRLKVRRDYDDFCDSTTIGYLLASTYYFVHYFSVRIRREDSGVIRPGLELLGNKLFKSSAIVHACWSPHLPEESLMLLECLGQRNGGKVESEAIQGVNGFGKFDFIR